MVLCQYHIKRGIVDSRASFKSVQVHLAVMIQTGILCSLVSPDCHAPRAHSIVGRMKKNIMYLFDSI